MGSPATQLGLAGTALRLNLAYWCSQAHRLHACMHLYTCVSSPRPSTTNTAHPQAADDLAASFGGKHMTHPTRGVPTLPGDSLTRAGRASLLHALGSVPRLSGLHPQATMGQRIVRRAASTAALSMSAGDGTVGAGSEGGGAALAGAAAATHMLRRMASQPLMPQRRSRSCLPPPSSPSPAALPRIGPGSGKVPYQPSLLSRGSGAPSSSNVRGAPGSTEDADFCAESVSRGSSTGYLFC